MPAFAHAALSVRGTAPQRALVSRGAARRGAAARRRSATMLLEQQPEGVARPSRDAPPTGAGAVSGLKRELREALVGMDRGLSIDADSETAGEQEGLVEDLIEQIEDLNGVAVPVTDGSMSGAWTLVYTSSSITRYFGGATGLQRLLPKGCVGQIVQVIDTEDGTSEIRETLEFEAPLLGKKEKIAVAFGKMRATGEIRQVWDPEYVNFSGFKRFAEGWKTLRAFQIADTTFLDDGMRITRGQTGSVNVFTRGEEET